MADRNFSYTLPKWVMELTPYPKQYVASILRNVVFAKMKEYERQRQVFESKYKIPFSQFEKRVKTQKTENFEFWDDYIVWKGLQNAYHKWHKRYQKF